MINKKGQAEVMDGLILMLISATCGVVLLSISANYGVLPVQIYEETYAQKLSQNSLLSLYHITDLNDGSVFYQKSIMVAVSNDLSNGDISLSNGAPLIQNILDMYSEELGWEFMFAILPDNVNIDSNSIVSTDSRVTSSETFNENVGNPYCASAALTYPNTQGCNIGGSAGNMCYSLFNVCVWLP